MTKHRDRTAARPQAVISDTNQINSLAVVGASNVADRLQAKSAAPYNTSTVGHSVHVTRQSSNHNASLARHRGVAGRVVAGIAGVVAASAALAILISDAALSGTWTLDAALAPVTVGLTILAGHLVGSAVVSRRWVSACGFVVLFAVGTMLTVYSSVGRQAEASGTKALAIETAHTLHAAEMGALTRDQAMLDVEQKKLADECKTGAGRACGGIQVSIGVYQAAVEGHLRRLEHLGPEKVANGAAVRLAELVALLGGDGAHAQRLAVMLEPVARTLLLEMGSIVCFGFAFSGSRQSGVGRSHVARAPKIAAHGEALTTAPKTPETLQATQTPATRHPESVLTTAPAQPLTPVRTPPLSKATKPANPAKPVKSAEPSSQPEGTALLSALPKGARVLGNIRPALRVVGGSVSEVVTAPVVTVVTRGAGEVVTDGLSRLSQWVVTLTVGAPAAIVQRELALALGISQQAVCKGLQALDRQGVVTVVTRKSGTVVTRLAA